MREHRPQRKEIKVAAKKKSAWDRVRLNKIVPKVAKNMPKTRQYQGLIDKWAQDRVTVRDTPAKKKKK